MKQTIKNIQHRRHITRQHVHKKLRRRITMFFLVISVLCSVVIYNIVLGRISPALCLLGLTGGVIIGIIAGRMFKIAWHEETQKVISRLDRIGVIFLALYISVEIGRKWLFGYWIHGAALNAFGLIFLAGLMLGRLMTTVKSIRKILIRENKLQPK